MIRSSSTVLRALFVATTAMRNAAAGQAQSCTSSSSSRTMQTSSTPAPAQAPAPAQVDSYPLLEKWQQSPNSWLLRFALPPDRQYLGDDPTLPTCISVHHNDVHDADDNGNSDTKKNVLKKSYSPVSHPSTIGTFDLLVKSYPYQPGGGVGAAICDLQPGQHLVGKLKAERMVHGSPIVSNRWDNIGLIAGGTGIAPLLQIVRIVLEDGNDPTKIRLLNINRYEEDILMREELDRLERQHPDRFTVSYSLTGDGISDDWRGHTGRGSVEMAREALPPPSAEGGGTSTTMIFVCGTDGFRDMWAGPVGRGPPKADGSKGPKIQGPLLGLLRDAGYDATDVFKY